MASRCRRKSLAAVADAEADHESNESGSEGSPRSPEPKRKKPLIGQDVLDFMMNQQPPPAAVAAARKPLLSKYMSKQKAKAAANIGDKRNENGRIATAGGRLRR